MVPPGPGSWQRTSIRTPSACGTGTTGSESHAPLGIRLAQVLDHGTHRSQICTALTTLGVEPPDIDVWDFGDRMVASSRSHPSPDSHHALGTAPSAGTRVQPGGGQGRDRETTDREGAPGGRALLKLSLTGLSHRGPLVLGTRYPPETASSEPVSTSLILPTVWRTMAPSAIASSVSSVPPCETSNWKRSA